MVLFSKEKMGVNFYIRKKTIPGGEGGSEGGMAKDHEKYVFFSSAPFPYLSIVAFDFLNS